MLNFNRNTVARIPSLPLISQQEVWFNISIAKLTSNKWIHKLRMSNTMYTIRFTGEFKRQMIHIIHKKRM